MPASTTDDVPPTEELLRKKEYDDLLFRLVQLAPAEAAELVAEQNPEVAASLLVGLCQAQAVPILEALDDDQRKTVLDAVQPHYRTQWQRNVSYPPNSIGALMRPPIGVLPSHMPLSMAIEQLKQLSPQEQVTYFYSTDYHGKLEGVVVLKDLFLNPPDKTLADVMITPPFYLSPESPLLDAMKSVVSRHFPVYPVCDEDGRIVGLVRGHSLFEQQSFVISAQAGSMVGVKSKERLSTRWVDSVRFRQPWLQINLLLTLLSAVVIGYFQGTIGKLVILAVFFPIVTSQARNTGAQTMAVTLRALSTGEWEIGETFRVLVKETSLGLLNGLLVGLVSALILAWRAQGGHGSPLMLGASMLIAMTLSCGLSGLTGVAIPLVLRWFGADPALAATILHTTFSTVISQGLFLGIATWLAT
jgi:magnesium transporter